MIDIPIALHIPDGFLSAGVAASCGLAAISAVGWGLRVATVELDEARPRLAAVAPRLARVGEYRFFGGLTEQEIAEAMGVTRRTVQRDWTKARALLHRALVP